MAHPYLDVARKKLSLRTSLPTRPVIGYTRKSKTEATKQVASHEQQAEKIVKFAEARGYGSVKRWFQDSQTGTNFDRAKWKELVEWCEANNQPPDAPGWIIAFDIDRVGRPTNKAKSRTAIREFSRWELRLADAGWEFDFVESPRTGEETADNVVSTIKRQMAAQYSVDLSRKAKRGKVNIGTKGYWLGGPPPFPAERFDTLSQRYLERGQRGSNGAVVLAPPRDAYRLQTWHDGADMLIAGVSMVKVAEMFAARGMALYYENRDGGAPTWGHNHIRKIYSNVGLVGKVEYEWRDEEGKQVSFEGEAKWGPIVDAKKFDQVQRKLGERRQKHGRRARPNRSYVLDMECYACGARFVAATFRSRAAGALGTEMRNYTHPVPSARMNDVQAQRTAKHGCKHWYIPADEVENAIRDLILSQRGTKDFYDQFVALLDEAGSLEQSAKSSQLQAEARVRELEAERENVKMMLRKATSDDVREVAMEALSDVVSQLVEANKAVDHARESVNQAAGAGGDLLQIVEDAKNIERTWNLLGERGVEARRTIVDTWVYKILVEVKPVEGKPRSAVKKLYVFLRTSPNDPFTAEFESNFEARWRNFRANKGLEPETPNIGRDTEQTNSSGPDVKFAPVVYTLDL